jgi:hypothetical protein
MRRLSLLGNLSTHGSPMQKSGGRDVFRTLDEDNDSWSASLGSSAVFVKPQIERIGDNDEEWFSEAEQRSGDDSFSSNRSKSPAKKRGSGKSHGSGKSMLPARQPSNEEVLRAMANTVGSFSQFEPSELSCVQPQQTRQLSRHASSSPIKRKKVVASPKRGVSSDACLQFDFAKARAIRSGKAAAVPMDAFLVELETTDAEITDQEESSKRLARDRIKKKSSRDDPMRKQRRSERARKMEEAVECSESESDYGDLGTPHDRMGAGRKQSILGDLSDEDLDVLRYSGHNKEAAAAPVVPQSTLSSQSHSPKKSSVRRSVSEVVEPDGKSSSPSKKSSTRRSASEAVRPDSISSSSRKRSSGSKGKTEKPKPVTRLAPSKKDYESDASRRRPKASRKPMSPVAADHHHRKKDREDDSDCSDDDDSDSGQQRRAIPAQYQVKNNIGNMNHNGSHGKKSPGKEKRRPSIASARPGDVVDAIRRRYSVSSSVYNTDTEADDQSTMTDDSEVSRRSFHRRSLDAWREKEKFKQQADSTFDSHTSEPQINQNEKELQRQQMLDQSRRGPVRSQSRQRSAHDADRSDSTRLVGQLLGEPETSNNDSSSDHEKIGGGRVRRQSLEVGYGQDSVYGSLDQIDRRPSTAAGNKYLPSGLNQAGRRGSQTCDRRGSQTGADSATDSMRNLMQTLAGSAKVESSRKTTKKKEKLANSPTEKTKEPGGGTVGTTSHDKSIDEILKARRLRGAKGRQKINPEKEEAKKFNAMNLLTAGILFK